jgi:preprotein translocase subunit SecA
MNKHREIMYTRRQKLLVKIAEGTTEKTDDADSLRNEVLEMIKREVESIVEQYIQGIDPEEWKVKELKEMLGALHPELSRGISEADIRTMTDTGEVTELITNLTLSFYDKKIKHFGEELSAKAERIVVLQSIDSHWMNHIDAMAHLREQVAFSGYAQRDPLIEYQDQGFRMFQKLLVTIASTTVRTLLQIDFLQFAAPPPATEELENLQTNESEIEGQLNELGVNLSDKPKKSAPNSKLPAQSAEKIGRNDPCPCGSGKKYKKCHGKDA